ncbi:MAG: Uma2 family endonuclease [Isosphaeraceae bacterium]
MSVLATAGKAISQHPVGGEERWVIPGASWNDYQTLARLLPATFRLAYDGSNLEMMVTGTLHEDYADTLDAFFKAVAGALNIPFKPYGSATWDYPEVERGIQADRCYYLDPAKIKAGYRGRARKSNKNKDYPAPDLAIEVDISRPKADRESIYAALRVLEIWVFDGKRVKISRLGKTGRYRRVERSGFLPLRAARITPWVLDPQPAGYDEWIQRIRSWARETLG